MMFTKECVTITAAYGMSGVLVTHILDGIALFCGPPATIRADQENASTCRAPAQRACEHGVVLRLILPGKSNQDVLFEPFKGDSGMSS